MKIWAHTLVKNEERFLWFAATSIIDHVDKMLLWDTGSTDNTVKIAKALQKKYPKKISFKEVGSVDIDKFTEVRQQMLEETAADWFIIADGDEIWWEDRIKDLTGVIQKRGNDLETIVSSYINPVGDIFHFQGKDAGNYKFDEEEGFLNIRAASTRIPGLHFKKPHGQQGLFDEDGMLIQERQSMKRLHLTKKHSYIHATNLKRSTKDDKVAKRDFKFKYELGTAAALDFFYPESFFSPRPGFVQSAWQPLSKDYFYKALLQTPLKKIKRAVLPKKKGY